MSLKIVLTALKKRLIRGAKLTLWGCLDAFFSRPGEERRVLFSLAIVGLGR